MHKVLPIQNMRPEDDHMPTITELIDRGYMYLPIRVMTRDELSKDEWLGFLRRSGVQEGWRW